MRGLEEIKQINSDATQIAVLRTALQRTRLQLLDPKRGTVACVYEAVNTIDQALEETRS